MDTSALGAKQPARVFTSRKEATIAASQAIMRSDIQEQLGEKTGGFVWKVEKYPNWLQISVDVKGNSEADERDGQRNAEAWFKEHGETAKQIFQEKLGPQFGELFVTPHTLGKEVHLGGCCRTGCAGCFNGPRDRLVGKMLQPGTLATDQCDRLG